jgi:hypothetical protein
MLPSLLYVVINCALNKAPQFSSDFKSATAKFTIGGPRPDTSFGDAESRGNCVTI